MRVTGEGLFDRENLLRDLFLQGWPCHNFASMHGTLSTASYVSASASLDVPRSRRVQSLHWGDPRDRDVAINPIRRLGGWEENKKNTSAVKTSEPPQTLLRSCLKAVRHQDALHAQFDMRIWSREKRDTRACHSKIFASNILDYYTLTQRLKSVTFGIHPLPFSSRSFSRVRHPTSKNAFIAAELMIETLKPAPPPPLSHSCQTKWIG